MATKIFVNLPVKNLSKSMEFFSRLGYSFNDQFTDQNAACMIISDDIYVMLLMEEFFRNFTDKDLTDTSKSTEVILALSADTRGEVDEFMRKVISAGGSEPREPQDHGFMYQRSFQDIDGHLWEIFYMDPTHVQ